MVAVDAVRPTDLMTPMEAEHRARARFLDRRILLVAAVLIGQLAVLARAIDAWAEQRPEFLLGSLGFQLGCFLLTLTLGLRTGRVLDDRHR